MSIYLPPHFEQTDATRVANLIATFPLATVITSGAEGLTANHIPLQLDPDRGEHGSLQGHVARNNPMWQEPGTGTESLVIFQSPDAYISPNWYPSKQEHHRVVPTWNYAVVHVYGDLIFHDDEKWLRAVIGKLTRHAERDQSKPWFMGQAPQDFLREQLANIIGIELRINRMIGKWKMSQNRDDADRHNVIANLRESDDPGKEWIAATIAGT